MNGLIKRQGRIEYVSILPFHKMPWEKFVKPKQFVILPKFKIRRRWIQCWYQLDPYYYIDGKFLKDSNEYTLF